MTQLDAAIGPLIKPIVAAFRALPGDFWNACAEQDDGTRDEVADAGFREEVQKALEYLDRGGAAVLLLGKLLLARPGDPALRMAIGQAYPDALQAVSEERFKLECLIATTLSSAQAVQLRASLDRIDALSSAVTAYKTMHDALHQLQPHMALMHDVALNAALWPTFPTYIAIVQMQLTAIDGAAVTLRSAGVLRLLDFRDRIGGALDAVRAALPGAARDQILDAVNSLASRIGAGLDSIDVSMRNAAQDANQPFAQALDLFEPLAKSAKGSGVEALITSYVAFAKTVSAELLRAVSEHERWQVLDQKLDQLQRLVGATAAADAIGIDAIWTMTSNDLAELCCAIPPPDWATPIVTLLDQARLDLKAPVTPPLASSTVERVNALASDCRSRFTAVDKSILDWLQGSVAKRPELVSLLNGDATALG